MATKAPMHQPALADAEKCTVCEEDGRSDKQADFWCVQCQKSLCSTCAPHHNRYNRSHVTMAVQQMKNSLVMLQAESHICSAHGKQLELLCLDCRLAKCIDCVGQCKNLGHTTPQLLKSPQGEKLLADARESIRRLQMIVLSKSKKLVLFKDLVRKVELAQDNHLHELKTKIKYAMDALSQSYEKTEGALNKMYDRLEEDAPGLQCLANQLEQSMQQSLNCVSSLTDMSDGALFLEQRATLMSRLEMLSEELEGFKALPNIDQFVTLNGSMPEKLNGIFASWIGCSVLCTDLGRILAEVLASQAEAANTTSIAQRQQLHFGPASSSFKLPFHCSDLSVTSDGHLLLAALSKGMREYDMNGHELSSWQPLTKSDGEDDRVNTVAALDDGRAAVGMFRPRPLVLLQRSPSDRAAWIVERRLAELPFFPKQLSVLGDLVAMAMFMKVQVVRLSSGQLLYTGVRDYIIGSMALTAAGVVTLAQATDSGKNVHIAECFSHRGERLWRWLLSDERWLGGVCSAPARQLLVCVYDFDDGSKDSVRAMDREGGQKVIDVLTSSSHGVRLPMRLSMSRKQLQQVLAVLCTDKKSGLWNKVAVHTAVSSRDIECKSSLR